MLDNNLPSILAPTTYVSQLNYHSKRTITCSHTKPTIRCAESVKFRAPTDDSLLGKQFSKAANKWTYCHKLLLIILMKIILKGAPGVGKSTLIHNTIKQLNESKSNNINDTTPIFGVIAREKLDNDGVRQGFAAILDNKEFADVQNENEFIFMRKRFVPSKSHSNSDHDLLPNRIGNYDVDVEVIETKIIPELSKGLGLSEYILYIDEIGKAQMLSTKYKELLHKLFADSNTYEKIILASIVEEDIDWSLNFKYNEDSWLIRITSDNRSEYHNILVSMINSRSYLKQCTKNHTVYIKKMFEYLKNNNNYLGLNKLFKNAIEYVVKHHNYIEITYNEFIKDRKCVRLIGNSSAKDCLLNGDGASDCVSQTIACNAISASGRMDNAVEFAILGHSDSHVVKYHSDTNVYYCDCPLSTRQEKFQHVSRENAICSHQMCVRICTNNVVFQSKNLF